MSDPLDDFLEHTQQHGLVGEAELHAMTAPKEPWETTTSYGRADLTLHPLIREAYKVACLIENCGASPELTTASCAAFDLCEKLADYFAGRKPGVRDDLADYSVQLPALARDLRQRDDIANANLIGWAQRQIAKSRAAAERMKRIAPLGVDTYPECYKRLQAIADELLGPSSVGKS
jgi:hypothetical protein